MMQSQNYNSVVGLKLKDVDETVYDNILNFFFKLDYDKKEVLAYKFNNYELTDDIVDIENKGEYLGILDTIVGMSEEEFVEKALVFK